MMKKLFYISLLIIFIGFSSFGVHKFYTAIYQIEFVPKKKQIQITTRIFLDDLNEALTLKYHKKSELGTDKESNTDIDFMKQYILDNFSLKVNGQSKKMNFLYKEIEDNVVIGYLTINTISSVKTIEVQNTIITEVHDEQQNIIQAKFNSEKHSLLLTAENFKGMLK